MIRTLTTQTEAVPDEPGLAVEVAARHPDGLVLGPGEGGVTTGGEAGALLLLLGAPHAGHHPLRLLHLLQLGQLVRQQPHVVRGAGLQVPLQLPPSRAVNEPSQSFKVPKSLLKAFKHIHNKSGIRRDGQRE